MKNVISKVLPILILAIGLPIMAVPSAVIHSQKIATVLILFIFIVYNIISSRFLNLQERLKSVWSIDKTWHFLIGFLIGAIPIGTAYLWYFSKGEPLCIVE